MSVTMELYVYDEQEVSDEILRAMGVQGGITGKLMTMEVSADEIHEAVHMLESYTVGETKHEFISQLSDEVDSLVTVDEQLISDIEDICDEYADENEGYYSSENLLKWVKDHEGEEIFARYL